jgi:hypothetical protein
MSLGIARVIFSSLHRTPKYGKFLSDQVAKKERPFSPSLDPFSTRARAPWPARRGKNLAGLPGIDGGAQG